MSIRGRIENIQQAGTPPDPAESLGIPPELGLDPNALLGANCDSSANTQSVSNQKFNRDFYQGYLNAVENAKTNGGNAPPIIRQPDYTGNFKAGVPYFRPVNVADITMFCRNGVETPINEADNNWNWSQVF